MCPIHVCGLLYVSQRKCTDSTLTFQVSPAEVRAQRTLVRPRVETGSSNQPPSKTVRTGAGTFFEGLRDHCEGAVDNLQLMSLVVGREGKALLGDIARRGIGGEDEHF